MRQFKYLALAVLVCAGLLAVLLVGCNGDPVLPTGAAGKGLHVTRIDATTAATGLLATFTGPSVDGRLYALRWIDGDMATGVDITVTVVSELSTELFQKDSADVDVLYYPRALVHDAAGTALTGTAGGDRDLPLLHGVLTLVVGNGGVSKTGALVVYWLD